MRSVAELRKAVEVLAQFTVQNPKHPITPFVRALADSVNLQLLENLAEASRLRFDNERLRAKLAEAENEAKRLRERLQG